MINHLVRSGSYEVIGATAPSIATADTKMAAKQVALNPKAEP